MGGAGSWLLKGPSSESDICHRQAGQLTLLPAYPRQALESGAPLEQPDLPPFAWGPTGPKSGPNLDPSRIPHPPPFSEPAQPAQLDTAVTRRLRARRNSLGSQRNSAAPPLSVNLPNLPNLTWVVPSGGRLGSGRLAVCQVGQVGQVPTKRGGCGIRAERALKDEF